MASKNVFLVLAVAVTAGVVFHPPAEAQRGCCSHHGGVNGCSCADGTPLSKTCIKYFPQCQSGGQPATPPSSKPPSNQPAKPASAPQQTFSAKVVGVSDGDTITVLLNNQTFKIRLNGVDCPESKQAFGTQAKNFTSEKVFGKTVTVRVKEKDRYGRLVADILIGDWNLNYELVRAGLAWHYKAYSKDPMLAQLEQQARVAKRGLWGDRAQIAPWDFRKKKR